MSREQFVSYIDTDSLFIRLGHFLKCQGVDTEVWKSLDRATKVAYLIKLSKYIEGNINDRMFEEVQCIDYTSAVPRQDFTIGFKQEIVCDYALHIKPKMYAFHVINAEGFDVDEIDAKGIETVRSSSPRVFREGLKGVLQLLLTNAPDDDIIQYVSDKILEFYSASTEFISVNIGVNNILKYRGPNKGERMTYIKGTPYQVKGAIEYLNLIKELDLEKRYEPIHEGDKCKFTYVKRNRWGIEGITYFNWPREFKDHGIIPDVDKQIDKYFIGKAKILLDPIHKTFLLESSGNSEADFF